MKVLVPIGFAVFVGPAVLAAQNVAPPTPASVVAAATADEWVEIAAGDLLVMELSLTAEGKPRQVVIQLLPSPFSQAWVANITALARAHWWDGTSVYRVVDNWVAQWGDGEEKTAEAKPLPTGIAAPHAPYTVILAALPRPRGAPPPVCTDPDGHCERPHNSGAALARDPYALGTQFRLGWPIAADPSADAAWPVHCYGSVGVARDLAPDTGTGAELYAVIGHAPRQFDRNIAVVGRVIEGIEHLAILPRGAGEAGVYASEAEHTPIRSVRLASELREGERPRYEYLASESESFARYVSVRANRRDEFYHVPAGGVDVCNVQVPIRRRADQQP